MESCLMASNQQGEIHLIAWFLFLMPRVSVYIMRYCVTLQMYFSHCMCVCVYNWTPLTSSVPHSLSLCTFPGRAVQWISPWMYVTMMMTDQIPLDLAPPPLLNGEVPLMPHMVNGDAAQQVNTHTDAHAHVCHLYSVILANASFSTPLLPHTHTRTHTCARMRAGTGYMCEYTSNSYAGTSSLLWFCDCCDFVAHGLLPQVMNSCYTKAFVI